MSVLNTARSGKFSSDRTNWQSELNRRFFAFHFAVITDLPGSKSILNIRYDCRYNLSLEIFLGVAGKAAYTIATRTYRMNVCPSPWERVSGVFTPTRSFLGGLFSLGGDAQ
jgi:hypothetical protein